MHIILYAKYIKANLDKVMTEQCQHLNSTELYRLLIFFKKSEDLFDGKLGTWYTTAVDLELNNGVKPVCLRTYPLPTVNKAMFKKDFEILVRLWVLEEAYESEWWTLYFPPPKAKTNSVRLLSDFRNLNRHLKRKSNSMPKIREIILNL